MTCTVQIFNVDRFCQLFVLVKTWCSFTKALRVKASRNLPARTEIKYACSAKLIQSAVTMPRFKG